MTRKFILGLWLFTCSLCALADASYPKIDLDNGEIRVSIYLPDAQRGYYRGTRFDWSGIIESVEYRGHRFYAPLHPVHDPLLHDAVSGPAEEFAMFDPMGFAEAEAGESFVKIGVGLLAKGADDDYKFDGAYRLIRAGEWQVDHDGEHVSFTQVLQGDRGWAYRYHKTIRLMPGEPVLIIDHQLENSGSKTIDISHYHHNFTIIDGLPYGPDYRVEFPFETAEPISIKGLAWFRGNAIEVYRPLRQESLWIPVFEGDDPGGYNAALVRNEKTGAAVAFTGDAPITRMIFWAVARAACPEPFIRLNLAPGETREWSSLYRYSVDSGNPALSPVVSSSASRRPR